MSPPPNPRGGTILNLVWILSAYVLGHQGDCNLKNQVLDMRGSRKNCQRGSNSDVFVFFFNEGRED